MAFNLNDKPQMPQAPEVEDGMYAARCVRVIELGEQEDRYGTKPRVLLAFTVPALKINVDGEEKQRMFMTFPLNQTTNPEGTLAKYGKAMSAATAEEMIGKPCMIELEKSTKSDGTVRMNITNVAKPMAGMEIPEPDCDMFIFDFKHPDKEVFEKLTEYRQEQIKSAKNYQGSAVQTMLEGGQQSASPSPQEAEQGPVDEDMPF